MTAGRVIRGFRVEALLAGAAYAGLLVLADPRGAAALLDLEHPWPNRLFGAGLLVALAALGCLALRLWARLLEGGRHRAAATGERAVAGSVIVEFALVFPIVLLVMSMTVQVALIANATLVVRYAAFAAARSAIVSFEDLPWAFPPFPEWVDGTRPELAAELVLASISPSTGPGHPAAGAMESLLVAQPGSVWDGRSYADRMEWAEAATEVTTLRDEFPWQVAWYKSFPPLVQRSEHLIPPYLLSLDPPDDDLYVPLTTANAIVPTSIYGIQIPGPIRDLVVNGVQSALGTVSQGSGSLLDQYFASTPLNVDPLSPKQVKVTVEYDFLLTFPGLQLIPGLTDPPPIGSGGAVFTIHHEVWLQSTGSRRAGLLAFVPVFPDPRNPREKVYNTPLYWKK